MAQYNVSLYAAIAAVFIKSKTSLTFFDGLDRLKRLGEVYTLNALPCESLNCSESMSRVP
jgi:hypothetical protein